LLLPDDEAQACIDIPRAFIEAWFPDLQIILSERGATAIALAHFLYSSVAFRFWIIRQAKKEEAAEEEKANDPERQAEVTLLRPIG
jgi:cbb3-type cytochrome oxidase subunit 3